MAEESKRKNGCPDCQQDDVCYYAELLKGTDIGVLQQEAHSETSCWRTWIQQMGADPIGRWFWPTWLRLVAFYDVDPATEADDMQTFPL